MMTKQMLKNYLLENVDTLKDIVCEMNSWNGSLEHLHYYANDEEFLHIFFDGDLTNLTLRIFYGDYNPNHAYVMFNGYGNLVSMDSVELEKMLCDSVDEIVNELVEEYENVYLFDQEFEEMLEEYNEGK